MIFLRDFCTFLQSRRENVGGTKVLSKVNLALKMKTSSFEQPLLQADRLSFSQQALMLAAHVGEMRLDRC